MMKRVENKVARSKIVRRSSARPAAVVFAAVSAMVLLQPAQAADVAWSTTPVDGNFGGINWTPGTTPGSPTVTVATTDSLFFGPSTITALTNNNVAFTYNGLTFNSDAAAFTIGGNSFTLGGGIVNNSASNQIISAPIVLGATQTVTTNTGGVTLSGAISGAAGFGLTKAGTGTLTLTGANSYTGPNTIGAGTVVISANNNLGANAATVSLDNGATLRTVGTAGFTNAHPFTIGSGGATINQTLTGTYIFNTSGLLTGSGALTITGTGALQSNGNGVVVLNQANAGFTGSIIAQSGGLLEYGNAGSLPAASSITLNNQGEVSTFITTAANPITVNTGGVIGFQNNNNGNYTGAVTLNDTATISLRDWYNLATARTGTISGVVSGAGGLSLVSGTTGGIGTLILTNTNGYLGATTGTGSNLTVSGVNGSIAGSSGITLTLGTLTLDNAAGNLNRVNDAGNVTLNTGGITLTGNTTTDTTETLGTLALGGNNTNLTVNSQAGRVTTLTAAAFSRTAGSSALIRGTNLNQSAGTNVSRITFADGGVTLPQVGTNSLNNAPPGDATQALRIVPFAFGDSAVAGAGVNFLTYDTTLGLRVLTTAQQTVLTDAYTTAANPDNAIAFNGTLTTPSDVTLNSLLFSTATQTLNGSGGALIINSGAVAAITAGAVIGNGFSGLTLGNGEGVITTAGVGSLRISTPVSVAGGGLTKAGAGTLTLDAANSFSGTTNLNAGTLQLGTGGTTGSLGAASSIINNGQLVINRSNAVVQGVDFGPGAITGLGGVIQSGTGATTITASGYTGATSVTAGALNLTGSSTTTGALLVRGGGTLTLSGTFGVSASTNNTVFGAPGAGSGVGNILPGTTLTRGNVFIGDNGAAGGALYQSGGTITLSQAVGVDPFRIGSNPSGYGYYNLSGGSVTSSRPAIGASLADTIGVVDMSGGTFSSTERIDVAAGSVTSSGLLNVLGGTVNAGTDVRLLTVVAGAGGATSQAVVNIGGGAGIATVTTGNNVGQGVNLGQNNGVLGALGVLNLRTNGVLNTSRVLGTTANTQFNFDGGTLRANPIVATGGLLFADGTLDAVNVYGGGGTIDNNGTGLVINRGLLAPAGQGVSGTSIPVNAGVGYIGAPLVKFTGGSGTGATGYAVISGGIVTNIVLTSPGIGYTAGNMLTATFFGGGATSAAAPITGIAVAANVSGAMTFTGSGSTTLTAANTFAGGTTVAGGTVNANTNGALNNTATGGSVSVLGSAVTLTIGAGVTDAVNDAAALSLSGGGVANMADFGYLTLTGNETVGALFLNAFQQANGTYGSTASAATNQNDEFFSGAGVLTVVPEPTSLGILGLAGMGMLRRRRRNPA